MRRLQLLTFVVPLLSALACNESTAPTRSSPQIQISRHTLALSSTIPQIGAGFEDTCALRTDGTVVCWGYNGYGATTVPTGLTSVAQVSVGQIHTCAVKTDGTVVCWGYDGYGATTVPTGLSSVAQVSAGQLHTCALKTDGTVVCWGSNDYGQTTVPAGLTSVIQVSAGQIHTCALKADGTVACWGDRQPPVPAGLTLVAQVSAGGGLTCALKTDGTVVCWGDNTYGQATVPAGLNSVAQVSVGGLSTCAARTDGSLVCWGYNLSGEATVPSGLNQVAQVSAGWFHTCAVKRDGTAVCWGYNTYGEASVPACLTSNPSPSCPPVVGAMRALFFPAEVNTPITASAGFSDPGTLDTHTAIFDWGDGTSSAAIVSETNGFGEARQSHAYSTAGVYTITLTVADQNTGTGQSVFEFAVVYDPAAGFVTGDGSIESPPGAYAADRTLTGRAKFGFVSRYQKGATVPTGNTQFQFQAADLKFKSANYDWLVIAGPQAKYKGSGTINGAGDFGFLLSAVDGAVNGGGGSDQFRVKIWDKDTGAVIYDNQMGAADDAAASTVISSGDIIIHK